MLCFIFLANLLSVISVCHALKPSPFTSFLFLGGLPWAKLLALTARAASVSWPGWGASFLVWICTDLKGRRIQSYCCLPDTLTTSGCLFPDQGLVFRKLPIQLLFGKATLKCFLFPQNLEPFWPAENLLIKQLKEKNNSNFLLRIN